MKSNIKKICVVTGTRAEYGLLSGVMSEIKKSEFLDLQLIVTGMHLSTEFGYTINQIIEDGYFIDKKIEMLLSSDSAIGITKSMGIALIGFADAFDQLKPDLLLILGDRFEIFAAATAAMVARIPIAHCHGGESTEGLIDESIRHSITKMSHLHFVSADKYAQRVLQLGEVKENIYQVGALGIDNINRLRLLTKEQLEESLDFRFLNKNLLITFHPVTLESNTSSAQMSELLDALEGLDETGIIFTMPNADTDSRVISQQIQQFCLSHPNSKSFVSLGQLRYFSCIKYVDGVIGNSSSGLIEVPSFKKGTINLGDRQKGRLAASSVINCDSSFASINEAINTLYSKAFQADLCNVVNPYGHGGASKSIIEVIESHSLVDILKKPFFDLFP